jgi:hypothetical protein
MVLAQASPLAAQGGQQLMAPEAAKHLGQLQR